MDTQPDNLEPIPVKESTGSKRDFWLGFIGWWVFNLLATGILFAFTFGLPALLPGSSDYSSIISTITNALGCLVFLLNIGAIIFFAIRRKQVALGMLVAFGISIAITILLGVIAMVACFIIIGQYNNL